MTAAGNERGVRAVIDERVEAIRRKDIEAALAHLDPDVVLFDVVNPLRHTGVEGERQRLEEWFSQFEAGPIGFEMRDLRIAASDDVAFCHGLNHVSATTASGQTLDMWWRATICLRRADSGWTITHEHASVPFDVETGRASLDLKP